MCNEFDSLEQVSVTIAKYEVNFYALSSYFYASISTVSKKIQKFVKSFNVSLQLDTSQMVVYEAFFQSIVDNVKMTEGIIQTSQVGSKKVYHFGELKVNLLKVKISEVPMDIRVGWYKNILVS